MRTISSALHRGLELPAYLLIYNLHRITLYVYSYAVLYCTRTAVHYTVLYSYAVLYCTRSLCCIFCTLVHIQGYVTELYGWRILFSAPLLPVATAFGAAVCILPDDDIAHSTDGGKSRIKTDVQNASGLNTTSDGSDGSHRGGRDNEDAYSASLECRGDADRGTGGVDTAAATSTADTAAASQAASANMVQVGSSFEAGRKYPALAEIDDHIDAPKVWPRFDYEGECGRCRLSRP